MEDDIIEKGISMIIILHSKYYWNRWLEMSQASPLYKSRSDLMTIFWDPADQRWCEINEDKQLSALLENENLSPQTSIVRAAVTKNAVEKHRICKVNCRLGRDEIQEWKFCTVFLFFSFCANSKVRRTYGSKLQNDSISQAGSSSRCLSDSQEHLL